MFVAQAAPRIPIPKPKMNNGSRITLAMAPISMAVIDLRAFPSARMKALIPKPRWEKTLPQSTTRR